MSAVIDGLVFGLKKNVDYATRLVADLGESQLIQQPAGLRPSPLNHPAWVLSHLNVYIPVMIALVRGEEFDDPKSHPFGMQSKPENDRSIYPLKNELVQTFVQGHDRLAKQLANASDDVFEQPVKLARWKELMPKVGIALPYLLLLHENQHLGQVSAWRRSLGLPSV